MTPPTRLGTLRLMTTRFWTKMKLILLNALCRLMHFRNLWRLLKLVVLKCLRRIGYKFSEDSPEIGDYYIAIDLAGFQEVNKKRTKNTKLDETAIAVVLVNEHGWYIENIIHGRWDLNETAMKIFQAVRDYRPVSVGIERGIAKQAVMSPLLDLQKKYGTFFRVQELTHGNKNKTDQSYVGASRPF